MAGGRVLLVEDNTEVLPGLERALHRAAPGASVTCCHHNQVVDDPALAAMPWDLVVLDALAPLRNQYLAPGERPRSHLASVDVVHALERASAGDPPRVVAYSAAIHEPQVAIPLWELRRVITSRHHYASLNANLPAIVRGDDPGVGPPDADDYGDLGLGPDAQLVAALTLAASREDIWRWLVTGEHREKQRSWALDRLHPLLGRTCPRSSRHIIGVLRAVTRLGPS